MMKRGLLLLPLLLCAAAIVSTAAAQDQDRDNDQENPIYTGFIQKGDMTGNIDKLMNVNLFVAGRISQVDNSGLADAYGRSDADNVGIPGARIYLTGQVYTDIFYKVAYEFSNESDLDKTDRNGRLTDAMLTWKLPLVTDMINRVDFNVGLGPIFLSPAGEVDLFFLDTIEQPLIVQNILPPGTARDKGAYFKGSFLEGDIIQLWAGIYNGTHRMIGTHGRVPGNTISNAVDAWGSSAGNDVDRFAYMTRAQVNVLNEDNYFFMVSGGISNNSVLDEINNRKLHDNLFDAATEYRFNKRLTWIKGEVIRTRTKHAPDMYGFHITAGHRLAFICNNLEVVARYERQKMKDHTGSVDDLWSATAGVNYFFDPEHQNDGKFQLNYIVKRPGRTGFGKAYHNDNAILFQFVIGF